MKRFKGFTLSELMVALAVIGIIVAIVTPAIMKTRPNKNKMMVKKAFYTTEQIVNTLVNDEKLYPDMRDACADGFVQDVSAGIYCAWGFDYTNGAKFEGETFQGPYKFAALFKSRLNVSKNDPVSKVQNATPDNGDFYPIFYTSDGIKWDLTGTRDAWTSGKAKVGTFGAVATDVAGTGSITIDVNGDETPNVRCTGANADDCDRFVIQILANGKLRIDPTDETAINWATINTSIRDGL